MSDRSASWRTCIGCRTVERPIVLLRLVAAKSTGVPVVEPDPAGDRPGRGAWIHPDLGCLHAAQRRRAFGRALRLAGQVDIEQVTAYLEHRVPTESAGRPS